MKSGIFEKLMDNYMVITCSIFFYIYNAWNFHGEATNFRGAMSNFRGEATNFSGAMSNFHGEAGSGVTGQGNTVFHARKQRFLAKKTLFSQW